jgi:ABC-2 type transport system permease protein
VKWNLVIELWLRTMYARTWVRLKSMYGEPLWILVGVGFPLFTSFGLGFLYRSSGISSLSGFAVLGGIMVAFWGNVLWSMASQFYWDKQEGIFEIYLISPAPITAILVGMSLGGIIGTAPSALIVGVLGWSFFAPQANPSWGAVALTFLLTIASLYALGMLLSSFYLAYGREAESLNDAVGEPISLLSGLYYPSIGRGSPFPIALQAIASLIPLTIGMDALRKSLFYSQGSAELYVNLLILAIMATLLLILSKKSLDFLREQGRRKGTLTVRLK